MATLNTLGVDTLALRGAGNQYHNLSRVFANLAEAQNALANGDYVPVMGRANLIVVIGHGIMQYDSITTDFIPVDSDIRSQLEERINELLGNVGENFDTLKELADAIGNSPTFFDDTTATLNTLTTGLATEVADRTTGDNTLQSNLDAVELFLKAVIGSDVNTTDLGTFTGSTIADASTVKEALQALETSLEAVDIDTDDLAALTGISENITHLGGFTGSTIGDDVSVKDALQALETASEAETTRALAAEAALQSDVNQNEADADAAIAALQADVDQNEADADAAIAAVQADVDQNEADADAAIATLQADVDQNEADADAAIAAVQADVDQNEADADAAIAALQADVDQNEADADAAIAAVQADVDQNEADADAAIAAVQADVDQNEADADAAIAAVQADVDQNEADADAADAALSGRLDVLEADPTTETALATERARIDAILAGASADTDTFAEVVALINSVDTTNDTVFAGYVASNDAAVAALDSKVDDNESDIENKISDVNSALGLSVGDQTFSFSEDLLIVELDQSRSTDHAAIYSDITTAGPDAATNLDIKTALERFAANSRIVLAAEKYRMDLEDQRVDDLIGSDTSDLGTFTGSTIADNTNVKAALQSLETASETETSERISAIADILDGTTFTGSLVINRDYPDLELKSNGEKRLLFTDAGGGATAAIKHVGTTLDFYAGGIASGNLELSVAADGVDVSALKIAGADVTATAAELNYTGDLGTFTKDIISDNSDLKDALQELESSVASIQGAAKVHNYKWSNNNDATITAQHITTDAANWADATKVYIHRQARHSVDMQNAFNNMLNIGAKLYIQRTDVGDKFFTAIINSAATVTGTGTDQVFAYDVTDVSTIGQVFNDNMRVNVGVFSNVNEKMLDDGLALKANLAGDTFTGVVTIQDHLIIDDSNNQATEYNLNVKSSGSSVFGVLGNGAVLLGNNSGAPFIASADHHAASKKYVDDAINGVIDAAPGALDTLNELAAALGDDANFSTTITNSIAAIQADVDQNEADADAAIAAVQADVDQNEADADAAIALKLDASAVSTFGGTLIDDADAAAARTTLGLGTAATTASTDYATAAQGALADSALQADDISGKADAADSTLTGVTSMEDLDIQSGKITYNTTSHVLVTSGITTSTAAGGTGILTVSGNASLTSGCLVSGSALNVTSGFELGGVAVTSTAAELNILDGVTATAAELNILDGVTATAAELNYVDGVTSNIQTQLDTIQSDVDQNEADADAAIAAVLAGTSIPGPYNNDADAATGGVAVGAIYKNSNGTIHWRVS